LRPRRRAERVEGRLMGEDEFKYAGEEARLGGRAPDLVRLYTGKRQETRQEIGIGCDEAEGCDGKVLGGLAIDLDAVLWLHGKCLTGHRHRAQVAGVCLSSI